MSKDFLRLFRRSYHFESGLYNPEKVLLLMSVDEILKELKDFDRIDFAVFQFKVLYEIFHLDRRFCGDSINLIQNTLKVMDEIFFNRNYEVDVNHVIDSELANEILYNRSNDFHEALAAYHIDVIKKELESPSEFMKRLKTETRFTDRSAKEDTYLWSTVGERYKEFVLSKTKNGREIYKNLVWLSEAFDNHMFPLFLGNIALDLPYNLPPSHIINSNPELDMSTSVKCRFDAILDTFKYLDGNGFLHRIVPKITYEHFLMKDNFEDRWKKDLRLIGLIGELTGIRCGTNDIIAGRIDMRVAKLMYRPPIEKALSLTSKELKPTKAMNLTEFCTWLANGMRLPCIWTGMSYENEIILVPNKRIVPSDIIEHWINHFVSSICKQCIITKTPIDLILERIANLRPILNESKYSNFVENVRTIQHALELEKAINYDLFYKMSGNNN
ncbi:MAG: hypothetical protein QXN83_05400 [Nitrososphaerales archaeon]